MSNALREENNQPRILYPLKLSFKSEGEVKTFLGEQTWKASCQQTCLAENTKSFFREKDNYLGQKVGSM